jgi:protein-S-isoprenylcysteine O-methyltransferase Ste14
MEFLAKFRMLFLRILMILLLVLSVMDNDFRAFTLKITAFESLMISIFGFIMVLIGSFGRIWASIYIEGNKTRKLITEGPFSMVRNPLYFFSLLIMIGFCLALKSIYLGISLLIIFIFFHFPTILNEESKLKMIHKDEFKKYMDSTPRLFPNPFIYNIPNSDEILSVKIKKINRNLIQVIIIILLYTLIDVLYLILN